MKTFTLRKSSIPVWFTIILLALLAFAITQPLNPPNSIIPYLIVSSLGALFIVFLIRSQISRVTIHPTELQIFGDLINFKSKFENLQITQAKIVDLQLESGLYPAFRTFGVQIPAYNTGYFTLSNNHKAFVFITNHARVVYIPAKQGEDVLLSLENPEAFIAALKEVHANT